MASPRLSGFRSEHILREAAEPTFWLDKSLRLTWVNPAWERLTGYSLNQILEITKNGNAPNGDSVALNLISSHHPPVNALARQTSSSLAWIVSGEGERFSRVLDFWPFHNAAGELVGMLGRIRSHEEPRSENASADRELHDELVALRERLYRTHGIDSLVGHGHAHDRLLQQIKLAASSNLPLLIIGEPGVGKRAVAKAIHQLGSNRRKELNIVDIEAIPSVMLQASLFDALRKSEVAQEIKNGPLTDSPSGQLRQDATVAIGDIVCLPRDIQAQLASLIEKGIRVRVIAMTACEPEAALQDEKLLPELYYCLTPLVLRVPPLRNRRDEIHLLAQHFLEQANYQPGPRRTGFAQDAQAAMLAYDWPGNLFELERVVNHARLQGERSLIASNELPASVRGNLGGAFLPPPTPPLIKPLDELLTEIERRLIENALVKARRNKTRAADLLGISRPRLYRRMKELDLEEGEDLDDELGVPSTS